jgi:hypothetical protein
VFLAIVFIGIVCLAKYLRLCWIVTLRGENKPLWRHLAEIVIQLIQHGLRNATNDTGQGEREWNDISLETVTMICY